MVEHIIYSYVYYYSNSVVPRSPLKMVPPHNELFRGTPLFDMVLPDNELSRGTPLTWSRQITNYPEGPL